MRVNLILLPFLLLSFFLNVGCAVIDARFKIFNSVLIAPVVPPTGLIYTRYKAPLDVNFNDTNLGEKGASGWTIFVGPDFKLSGAFGKTSINEIAKNNITEIDYVDYEYMNVLGVYQHVKIIPHGK